MQTSDPLAYARSHECRDPMRRLGEFEMFPIGTRVLITTRWCDFMAFRGDETGVVVRNTRQYLGIRVRFDEVVRMRCCNETIYERAEWSFNPCHLAPFIDPYKEIEGVTRRASR